MTRGENLGNPFGGYASRRTDVAREDYGDGVLRRNALAAGVQASVVPTVENLAGRAAPRWTDLRIEGGALHGRPFGEPHAPHRVLTGAELSARTGMQLGESYGPEVWDAVADHLREQITAEQKPAEPEPAAEPRPEHRGFLRL